jgi:hypothetical protein
MILQIKSFISNLINELLEGLGGFNNTMNPNDKAIEELKREKELRDQAEIQNWRNKLKEDYKKESINLKIKYTKLSILQDILYVIIYNLLNIAILKLLTILWNFITCDILSIITLDPTILEGITPNLFFFRRLTKKPFIHPDEKLALEILNELHYIKGKARKQRITKNAIIILRQLFINCKNFKQAEDKRFDRIHEIMPSWDIHKLIQELLLNWSLKKYTFLKSNIENKNLRYYIIAQIILNYWSSVDSNIGRGELIREIQLKLNTNKQISHKTPSQSRKYHTSSHTPNTQINFTKTLWIILITTTIFHVLIFSNISPLNFISPMIDPNIFNLEFLPLVLYKEDFTKTLKIRKLRKKESYIESVIKSKTKDPITNEEITFKVIKELKLELTKEPKVIIENTVILLNRILAHYAPFPPIEDENFDTMFTSMSESEKEKLISEFINNIGTKRVQKLALNIENKLLRKYLIKAVLLRYKGLIDSEADRFELIYKITIELTRNNKNQISTIKSSSTIQSRKYHTLSQLPDNKTNWTKLGLWIILIIRLIARIIFYIFIFSNTLYPFPLNFINPTTFEDQLTEALEAAQDEEQDAYHEAAEIEAVWQNTEEELQDIAYFTGQTLAEVTQQYLNEN